MAEVGLLPFARIALQVSKAVLPRYRSRFSKHQFTQPQLLAILCLMRYEDWTFREAEVRLGEHRELRQALGLAQCARFHDSVSLPAASGRPDHRPRGRRDGASFARHRRKGRRRARVAVDATGLAQGAVSTFFRAAHASSRAKTAAVAALVEVGGRGGSGSAVPVVADRATRPVERLCEFARRRRSGFPQTRIGLVLADAEFDSERNHTYIRQKLGAQSVIPAKRGKKTWRIHGVRAEMRRAFPQHLYRRRALIESVFSSVKRKLSARAPGRSLRMQVRQALLLGLSFNLYRLRHRYLFLRMSTEPTYLINAAQPRRAHLRG